MKSTAIESFAPGLPLEGGFLAGYINQLGQVHALIVAPKAAGELTDATWNKSTKMVADAVNFFDGLANTRAMAKAGSTLAQWALDLRIAGHDDWYLPSLDELELCYRHLKPGTGKNDLWARSGINLSSMPPAYPYSEDAPAQTSAEAFRADAAEAFEELWYWSSTQNAGNSDYAWYQTFGGGYQLSNRKDNALRARAVRRLVIR